MLAPMLLLIFLFSDCMAVAPQSIVDEKEWFSTHEAEWQVAYRICAEVYFVVVFLCAQEGIPACREAERMLDRRFSYAQKSVLLLIALAVFGLFEYLFVRAGRYSVLFLVLHFRTGASLRSHVEKYSLGGAIAIYVCMHCFSYAPKISFGR